MSRLQLLLVVVVVAACSKKAEPPPAPAPTMTPAPTTTTATPQPSTDPAFTASMTNESAAATLVYSEDQVREACTAPVTVRDKIAACEGGVKALESEAKGVDSLKAALDTGIPSQPKRGQTITACKDLEARLRTIAAGIKCTL